jgi:hypothetical protein
LQVYDHHTGKKVYDWSSEKSLPLANFECITFANDKPEICLGLTDGTIQFHYLNTNPHNNEVVFRRGCPELDITLDSGDYAFTLAFSNDDMKLACGTQRRFLLVYEYNEAYGWHLRNKFRFRDFVRKCLNNHPFPTSFQIDKLLQEPGSHRRISGVSFCSEDKFLFATTTSARFCAYMYCIEGHKASHGSSRSYTPSLTKKGICRSALSPDGSHVVVVDGEGTVYKCEFRSGTFVRDKTDIAKVQATQIPSRASWVSWTRSGEMMLLDKKGNLKIMEISSENS